MANLKAEPQNLASLESTQGGGGIKFCRIFRLKLIQIPKRDANNFKRSLRQTQTDKRTDRHTDRCFKYTLRVKLYIICHSFNADFFA